jgi:hypothetical protein
VKQKVECSSTTPPSTKKRTLHGQEAHRQVWLIVHVTGNWVRTVNKSWSLVAGKEAVPVTASWPGFADAGAEGGAECGTKWKEHILHRWTVCSGVWYFSL